MNQMTHVDGGSIYRAFAENLFELVKQRGTISRVCLELDINRQQFNKYLNGSVLPNEITMRKIIGYFGVGLPQLFQDSQIQDSQNRTQKMPPPPGRDLEDNQYLAQYLSESESKDAVQHIKEGLYYCYAPWLLDPNRCTRTLIAFKHLEGELQFTRFVRLNPIIGIERHYKSRVQVGKVTQWMNLITLEGSEPKQSHRKLMMNFTYEDLQLANCISGLASTYSPNAMPICNQVLMHYEGTIGDWRKYIRTCGVIDIDDQTIRQDVAEIIATNFDPKNSILLPVDLLKKWR